MCHSHSKTIIYGEQTVVGNFKKNDSTRVYNHRHSLREIKSGKFQII